MESAMPTVLNKIAIPGIQDLSFTATANFDEFFSSGFDCWFYFSTAAPTPDFSTLVGIKNNDTGQTSGNVTFFTSAWKFQAWNNVTVDYSHSTSPINIDLSTNPQSGGFADTDWLVDVFCIVGSPFDDVIRGNTHINAGYTGIINDPGDNVLFGGGGNDIIEGRGGADLINGGPGSDTASYESSPSGVHVTVNDPVTGAFSASGGDADGDHLVSIENLIGSKFDDVLTGASNNNTFFGGLGNDTIDGKGGIDTVNYFTGELDPGFVSFVEVHLGLNGASGTGGEFLPIPNTNGAFQQVSIDTLANIENVIGTEGNDRLFGNELGNRLEGKFGNDFIDGGFGNDVLIGGDGGIGSGVNTVSFISHDVGTFPVGEINTITLGLNGADGSYTRSEFSFTGGLTGTRNVVETDVLREFQNVIGSNRAETINGNELDNLLVGRGGNDIIKGGAGNDTYDFSGPSSLLQGDDQYFDTSGTDKVRVNSFSDINGAQHIGNDLLVTLATGSFRIVNHFAGNAIETIVDTNGNSMVLATGNIGGNGSGIIAGGNGGETLDGRGGNDFLFGGNGSDRLIGGTGDDLLSGGNGQDAFVFAPGFGHDTITDFAASDRLEFDGGAFQNFQQVEAASQQVGNDTIITADADSSITLQGVDLHSLHSSNFIFVL
jgi:Ca2+-binding RTX toxin-like protein